MTPLAAWQNFYTIVGSAAGALIGLQFVVLSLVTNMPGTRTDPDAGHAFATPTIVHFATVLGLAAMLSAPWDSIGVPAGLWGFVGVSGVVYAIVVTRRMRAQAAYRPEFEDWLFHVALPLTAYASMAGSAYAVAFRTHEALLCVGGAVLLLLFIGIHNAWDGVTYHVFVRAPDNGQPRA
jgi:hypothetical protein